MRSPAPGIATLLATSDGSYGDAFCSVGVSAFLDAGSATLAAGDLNGDGRTDLPFVRADGAGLLLSATP